MRKLIAVLVAMTFGFAPVGVLADEPPPLQFTFPPRIDIPIGVPFAYSICLGKDVSSDIVPGKYGDAPSLKPGPAASLCNSSEHVTGGCPPYTFRVGSALTLPGTGGSFASAENLSAFLPIGLQVDANGVIRGMVKSAFPTTSQICVYSSGCPQSQPEPQCQRVTFQSGTGSPAQKAEDSHESPSAPNSGAADAGGPGTAPAPKPKKGMSTAGKVVIGTVLAGGVIAGAAVAASSLSNLNNSGGGCSQRQCVLGTSSCQCSTENGTPAQCSGQSVVGVGARCGTNFGARCQEGLLCVVSVCEPPGFRGCN